MADHDAPLFTDPDFPADPHEAAKLREQLGQIAAALQPGFWVAMQRLLQTADLLYTNLWRQPVLNPLPAALQELTGLTRADSEALHSLPDQLAFITELTLRGARLYYFTAGARHLLDTPLGLFVMQLHLAPEVRGQAAAADFQQLRASYIGLFEQLLGQLRTRASEELPDADWPLLHTRLTSVVAQATAQPNLFFNATPGGDPAPWPPLPAAGEEVKEYLLPAHHLPFLRLGAATLLMVAYKLESAWAQALLAQLPTARVAYLNSLNEAHQAELNDHDAPLRLTLATATDLHLVAHLCGLLAASTTWDELAAMPFGRHMASQNTLLAGQLPPGVSLPPPEPGDSSLRSSVAMVATTVAQGLEALFGADALPLAANRERVAQLAELT